MRRFVDHTSEVALELESDSEEGIFVEALEAFAELVRGDEEGVPARHEVRLEAEDRAGLLAAWLDELVFLADTAAFVPDRVAALDAGPTALAAVLEGRRADPRPLVKAVTYHGLAFEPSPRGWRARAVLDV